MYDRRRHLLAVARELTMMKIANFNVLLEEVLAIVAGSTSIGVSAI